MNILISGAHGYIGRQLTLHLKERGHEVFGISRSLLYGDNSLLRTYIMGVDVIINLAGSPILQRWTKEAQERIYNSRISSTRKLVRNISKLAPDDRPKKFISASAIGIYASGSTHKEESKNKDTGFLGKTVGDWEQALDDLPEGVQKHIFRLGLVLGKGSKIIKQMLPIFKIGLGGPIGNGQQASPFIHEQDVVQAFTKIIEEVDEDTLLNLCAPQQITNAEFTKALGKKLHRPTFFPVPTLALRLLYGRAASLLTESPQIDSSKLQQYGYTFSYPDIDSSLEEILS